MTDLILIKGNDKVWSPNELKEILTPAVEMYSGKKHKVQLTAVETENPVLKKRRLEEDNTIDIVCLDETSSSSNSNVIQSADSENSEIAVDNYISA